jgi:glucokinase
MRIVAALDIGGTKISAALVNSEGQILVQKKAPVARGAPDALVRQVAQLLAGCAVGQTGVTACGVIVPGIYFAATGNVWAPNLWGHEQIPLLKQLEAAIQMPVHVDSDRAGYVLGEQWMGAAQGMKDVVFLAVGTGIGAGIISNGHLLRGAGDIAGAVGWSALTPQYRDIYRDMGCWEAEASGPALARRAGTASAEQAIQAARDGDPAARQAVDETARYLGMGAANLVSLLNPEMIVLGGGLMQAYDLFLEQIRNAVKQWAQPLSARQVRIEVTRLGENAGLLGAARLAFATK